MTLQVRGQPAGPDEPGSPLLCEKEPIANRACGSRRVLGQQLIKRDSAAAGMQALQQRRPRVPRRVIAKVLADAGSSVCLLRGRWHARTVQDKLAVAPAMEVALVQVQQPGHPHMSDCSYQQANLRCTPQARAMSSWA